MAELPDLPLCAALKRLRAERNISQEQLSFEAGITSSALSRIERGLNDPRWTTVVKLASALELTPHELVQEAERLAGPATGS